MLSKQLKKLRNQKGLTQQQLANYLHVSKSSVGLWETNKREPDIDILITLADFYGVSVDYLLGHETINIKQNSIDEAIQLLELATQKLKDNVQD